MFRCRYDNICIHPHNVCDGVVHCKDSQDDESLCEAHCPYRCTCTGLTAVCNSTTHKRTHNHYPLLGLKVTQPRVDFNDLIHSCTSLLILDIEHTPVSRVELTGINNNVVLYMLTLKNNNLRRLPSESFNKLTLLRHLVIYDNVITVLETNVFNGLNNLQILNLSRLAMEKLENCCLCGMISLREIDLSSNNINVLLSEFLLTSNTVDVIDLSNNSLVYIQLRLKPFFTKIFFSEPVHYCFLNATKRDLETTNIFPQFCEQLLINYKYLIGCITLIVLLLIINTSVILHYLSFKAQHIILLHLAFADMFYVFYMATLTGSHLNYQEQFSLQRQQWFNSRICKVSMAMFIISLSQSKCVTFFLNISYLQGTKYMMERRQFTKRQIYTILICLWITTVSLSVIFTLFTDNTSHLCVPRASLSFQRDTYLLLIGYTMHLLLSVLNISHTIFTYLSIIRCIATLAKTTKKVKESRRKIRVLCIKAVIIVLSSFLCDGYLAFLPFINTNVLVKIEIHLILIATPQKVIADAFVYTYMNKIRHYINAK